ncbi:hypothetical protein SDC9_156205 [bioreactor metagenome]|uniref:Uncharacterized protein n=1 Tax=bioreactor metagenome TaxID=1076179 RepID=A0A645F427_9ZZZZ
MAIVQVARHFLPIEQIVDHGIETAHRRQRLFLLQLGIIGSRNHVFIIAEDSREFVESGTTDRRIVVIHIVILIEHKTQRIFLPVGRESAEVHIA